MLKYKFLVKLHLKGNTFFLKYCNKQKTCFSSLFVDVIPFDCVEQVWVEKHSVKLYLKNLVIDHIDGIPTHMSTKVDLMHTFGFC